MASHTSHHSASGGRAIRLCLVDDVREFRQLMRFGLQEDPRIEIVGEADDGTGALDVVTSLRPDVVLLDLSMPGLDGLEVIEALRQSTPDTRIVVLSGFAASRMEQAALDRGAVVYLEKGAPLAEIRQAVHEAAAA
jgi:DNA-binding NarL/FixJ family response regulator